MNKTYFPYLILLFAFVLAVFVSPLASSWPDGLEKVAHDHRFMERGEGKDIFKAPFSDYAWPGIRQEKTAKSVAGFAGTLLVFGLAGGIGVLLRKVR